MYCLSSAELQFTYDILPFLKENCNSFIKSHLTKANQKIKMLMDQIQQQSQESENILTTTKVNMDSVTSTFHSMQLSNRIISCDDSFSTELRNIKQTGCKIEKKTLIHALQKIGLGHIAPHTFKIKPSNGTNIEPNTQPSNEPNLEPSTEPNTKMNTQCEHKKILPHSGHVSCVQFSTDDQLLVTACENDAIVWDFNTGKQVLKLEHQGRVSSLAFYSDSLLGTGTDQGVVNVWDIRTLKHVMQFKPHTASVTDIAFAPDFQYILSSSNDRTAKLTSSQGLHLAQTFLHSNKVSAAQFSPDGKTLATASEHVRVWDTETGAELLTFNRHQQTVNVLKFLPVGTYVISGGFDKRIIVWNYETGKIRCQFTGHYQAISCVDFSPCGTFIASGAGVASGGEQGAGVVKLWNATTGGFVREYKEQKQWVNSIKFSHDGSLLSIGGSDRKATVRPVVRAVELRTYKK